MRLSIDIHLSLGKEPDEQQRDSDHTGYLVDASSKTGFTIAEPDDERERA